MHALLTSECLKLAQPLLRLHHPLSQAGLQNLLGRALRTRLLLRRSMAGTSRSMLRAARTEAGVGNKALKLDWTTAWHGTA